MDSLQDALEEALAGAPYQFAAEAVSEKLAAKGVELTAFEREQLVHHLKAGTGDVFSLEQSHPLESVDLSIEITEADLEAIHDRFDEFLSNRLPVLIGSLTEDLAESILPTLHASWEKELRRQNRERHSFEKRLHQRWGKAIELLRMSLTVSREFGEMVSTSLESNPDFASSCLVDVLRRLHARACQVTDEILCLLAAGFSDGAMARWRTLHEIAIVALFIKEHGEDVARRYIDHEVIESARAVRDYDECYERLGYEPMEESELEAIRLAHEKAVSDYGPAFDTPYGWAADALGIKRPILRDIEKAAGIDHLKAHYRLASHNVHANPKGVFFKLGLLDEIDVLLAGPSNVGLADPGHSAAISLLQVSVALGLIEPTLDSLVCLRIIGRLTDEIGEAFHEAHQQLQKDAG